MSMRLAREFDMFCLALRVPQPPGDAAALRNAIAAKPDWSTVVKGGRRQSATAVQRDRAQTAKIVRPMRRFADWEVIRLPDSLIFLYPVIRPIGWLPRRRRRQSPACA
jgi:hypothetical protein